MKNFNFFALFFILTIACSREAFAQSPGIPAQIRFACNSILNAISPQGALPGSVQASPSKSKPNYFYHWVRDSSLTLREAIQKGYTQKVNDFIQLTRNQQLKALAKLAPDSANRFEAVDAVLGAAKWDMVTGEEITAWMNPQNDGPALRASTLIPYYSSLKNGNLKSTLKDVIFTDLDFVARNYNQPSFDIWEEVVGVHFYTVLAHYRAMREGAEFALQAGNAEAATRYTQTASELRAKLDDFYSSEKGYLISTLFPEGVFPNGPAKPSLLDVATLLAVLHSAMDGDAFSIMDDRVMATVLALKNAFEPLYAVNQIKANKLGELLNSALGRYVEDHYNGYVTTGLGNPWFISTHAMAEYYYRLVAQLGKDGAITVTETNLNFFKALRLSQDLNPGQVIPQGSDLFREIHGALNEEGERYLRRSEYHTQSNGSQSEEINRDTGINQGAVDLTWNYASYLSMMRARQAARAVLGLN